jgi:hypothetical protein
MTQGQDGEDLLLLFFSQTTKRGVLLFLKRILFLQEYLRASPPASLTRQTANQYR